MLYCSTIGVFGDTQGDVIDETFQRRQVGFSSAYDATKYVAQCLVDQAVAQGAHIVSVMPSGIFGATDPHFMPVLRAFQKGRLKLWAGGERITGIVHVDDLVEGMLLAIAQGSPGASYILSAGDLSTRQMFELLGQATGIPVPREAPEPLVRFVAAGLDRIGRLSGWQPPIDNERVHYLYDRCVRVSAEKARRELGWNPRSPQEVLQNLLQSS
jgi:nucleoside-diphosphate-sugar epimerase